MNEVKDYKGVIAAIQQFTDKYPHASYGPCHIILDDYNLDDWDLDPIIEEIEATLTFLKWLRSLPADVRAWDGEDY